MPTNIPDPKQKIDKCVEFHIHGVPRYEFDFFFSQLREWVIQKDPEAFVSEIDLDKCQRAELEPVP